MTTKEDIKKWFSRANKEHTHMLVVYDSFDHSDYPVYIKDADDAREIANEYNNKSMQRVMEVYNLRMPIDKQLDEKRVFNY